MKFVKKSDLSYKNGYLVDSDNNVVSPGATIVSSFNDLETVLQKLVHESMTPKPVEAKEFHRASEHNKKIVIKSHTPNIDRKIKESIAIANELDGKMVTDEINEIISEHSNVFDWVRSDEFIACEPNNLLKSSRFDLPGIGNPLELTVHELVEIISNIVAKNNNGEIKEIIDADKYDIDELDSKINEILDSVDKKTEEK